MAGSAPGGGNPSGQKPNPNDRADRNFERLLPSGNTTAQQALAPVGPYHVNHFVCYFTIDGETFTAAAGRKLAGVLTCRFLKQFCLIFSQQNIARVQIGPRGLDAFAGSRALEFTVGSNVGTLEHRAMGFVHPDWVAMSSVPALTLDNLDSDQDFELTSFHGDTLKRRWNTELEKKVIKEIAVTRTSTWLETYIMLAFPEPLATILSVGNVANNFALASKLFDFNRLHFLAGTRSWRIGYDSSRQQFFVETIAIERFSCAAYLAIEKVHSTRNDIVVLWDNLLNNVIGTKAFGSYRLTAVPPPEALTTSHKYEASKLLKHIRHKAWAYPDLISLQRAFLAKDPPAALTAIKTSHPGLRGHLKG